MRGEYWREVKKNSNSASYFQNFQDLFHVKSSPIQCAFWAHSLSHPICPPPNIIGPFLSQIVSTFRISMYFCLETERKIPIIKKNRFFFVGVPLRIFGEKLKILFLRPPNLLTEPISAKYECMFKKNYTFVSCVQKIKNKSDSYLEFFFRKSWIKTTLRQ